MIVKNDQELEGLKEIGRIVAITLKEMSEIMAPGMTTKELDEIGGKILARYGAKSAPISVYNFPGHTCISVNEEVAHGIPGARVIKIGDLVNIDVSAHKNGYFADNGGSFPVGEVKGLKRRMLDCSKKALHDAISVAVAGNNLSSLGLVIEKEAKRSGFKLIRNLCGHGVGSTLHDDPESIFNYYEKKDKRILRAGMVLAIEPFISERDEYVVEEKDGWTFVTPNRSLTAQFEHSIVVTDNEPVILTLTD